METLTLVITEEQFIKTLIECRDYTKTSALEMAREYHNDIGMYVDDINGDESNIEQIKRFLKI